MFSIKGFILKTAPLAQQDEFDTKQILFFLHLMSAINLMSFWCILKTDFFCNQLDELALYKLICFHFQKYFWESFQKWAYNFCPLYIIPFRERKGFGCQNVSDRWWWISKSPPGSLVTLAVRIIVKMFTKTKMTGCQHVENQ